ncbi:MAG: septal ring lytic transglycosylase RlpA family protein [Rhodanobacter sp.]|uniref:septal ring lytic transglycosylase RlpA family protein n=1 Tax=Rhodanobacter sp. KK11 TaxID=3083255 RepID=UPI0029670BC7|nr:septal ring lytic transglycosylase RlpA family protein [Rhodanobacter sp. KK11]MDW2982868.1 septal ring lytic transglycosylase RlpA family protein [Rhodanobacter sp. KK11]
MRAAGAVALALAALLLAACGSHRTKPSQAGSRHGGAWGQSPGGARDDFHDDLSKPQSSRYRDGKDSVPPPLDVSKLVEPVPKVEPRSLYGNKSPYTVLGRTYRVLPSARGYNERGIASFYGNKFHGYKTSSLETYDMYAFSAASTTLPLPSYARVTNLENGKSVIVRVNDRGPFHDNRLIDLSYAAAVKIGVYPKGTGLVEVRGIDPAQPLQELPPPTVVTSGHPGIYLQVGAFADADNADRLAQRLRQANLGAVQVSAAVINGKQVRRVRVGPLASVDRADQVTARIEGMGLPRPQVAVD